MKKLILVALNDNDDIWFPKHNLTLLSQLQIPHHYIVFMM